MLGRALIGDYGGKVGGHRWVVCYSCEAEGSKLGA